MEKLPILLLPGLVCDQALWEHQSRHLSEVARPLIADLTTADAIGALARSVLATAPQRFALAGLSMGGYVAFEILRLAPERVARLALLDTNAHADTPEATQRRQDAMRLAGEGRLADIMATMLAMLVHPERARDPAIAGTVRAMAERVGADAFARQQTAIIIRVDSRPDLPDIACPTLVLCGRQDALCTVETHAAMAAAIPGARLAVIEECGHLSPIERPQAVTALLRDWLIYS